MRFGHRIQGKIAAYDDKGRGIFELHGEDGEKTGRGVAAIPFTAVGDEIAATFVSRDRGVKLCKLETIVTPSAERTAAPCPHAGTCGGCLWQHLNYPAQLEAKREMINRAFAQAGHDERVADVAPCPQTFHYRNRMDYAVGWNSEIGLKEYGSWARYVDVKTCLLLDDGAGDILQHVRDWMAESDLQPWDAKYYSGDIRYVVVREGKNTGQRLIVIVVKDAARVTEAHRASLTTRLAPYCTSLLIGEQNLTTDISLAQTFDALKGEPWLEEEANSVRYRIHPNSFFQTNSRRAEELQKCVLNSLHVSLRGGTTKQSPEIAALHVVARNDNPVILDPPRSGLHPKVLKTVLEMKPPTIVYV
jgi:tRNA/tmRNA/rRNA uracil-C5-methylase (TrmA/RlmC/RlmD family)